MTELDDDSEYPLMDDSEFIFTTNRVQSPLPSAEIDASGRRDFDSMGPFDLFDATGDFMTLMPEPSFQAILESLRTAEGLDVGNGFDDLCSDMGEFHSTESNDIPNAIQNSDERLAMIKSNSTALPVIRPLVEKLSTEVPLGQAIALSESVAVTVPKPNQLKLLRPLETTYKARYKSDYFPQNGIVRRPRYVADDKGSHYVTLKMPSEYSRDLGQQYLRIALITTLMDNQQHYYSPYKFQVDHDDVKVPDQNPTYVPVELSKGTDSMKLQLVLIKSKLDQLSDAQPLKLFSDSLGTVQNIINDEKLASKDLINKYQLEKSHLAFTLCTKLPDGSYAARPETTTISSVITEAPMKRKATSTPKPSVVSNEPVKTVSCPNCKHCFDPTKASVVEPTAKRKAPVRTSTATTKTVTSTRVTKKKKVT